MAGETLGASLGSAGPADLKESFNAGPPAPGHPLAPGEAEVYQPTPWPDAVSPGLRTAWRVYYAEMLALGARLMSLAARGLGLSPDAVLPQRQLRRARVECLPTCVGAGPRYEAVVAGPYLMDKFRATVT